MKRQKTNIYPTLITLFFITNLFGQESTNTSGGDAIGGGGSVAYSVGQVFYKTDSTSTGIISQGVQQAYEIFTLFIDEENKLFDINIFPNPTTNFITLALDEATHYDLDYKVVGSNGKILLTGACNSQSTFIDMSTLPVATYFVSVYRKDKVLKNFKIIKN